MKHLTYVYGKYAYFTPEKNVIFSDEWSGGGGVCSIVKNLQHIVQQNLKIETKKTNTDAKLLKVQFLL